MIRISEICKGSKRRLLVEGTLAGDWVEVLEKSWLEAQTSRNGEPMRIDLSGVTWIDDKGRELLKRILQDDAELLPCVSTPPRGLSAGSATRRISPPLTPGMP